MRSKSGLSRATPSRSIARFGGAFRQGKILTMSVNAKDKKGAEAQALKKYPRSEILQVMAEAAELVEAVAALKTAPKLVQNAVKALKRGDPNILFAFDRVPKAERDAVDAWLIKMGHPLAMKAGTAQGRFQAIVQELAK